MKFLFWMAVAVVFFVMDFKKCEASVCPPPSLSGFFELKARAGIITETKTIIIANFTKWRILCFITWCGEMTGKIVLPGEFLSCRVENPYNYNLPTHCVAKIAVLAVDSRGGFVGKVEREVKIDFCGWSTGDEILVIMPGFKETPKIKIKRGL